VSHLLKSETSLVIWLNIVTIVGHSVCLLLAYMFMYTQHHLSVALLMMVWSMPCQRCRKRCFSSQNLFR